MQLVWNTFTETELLDSNDQNKSTSRPSTFHEVVKGGYVQMGEELKE